MGRRPKTQPRRQVSKVVWVRLNGRVVAAKIVDKVYVLNRGEKGVERRIYVTIPKEMIADAYLVIPIDRMLAERLKEGMVHGSGS